MIVEPPSDCAEEIVENLENIEDEINGSQHFDYIYEMNTNKVKYTQIRIDAECRLYCADIFQLEKYWTLFVPISQ